jgi:hypothetical protein
LSGLRSVLHLYGIVNGLTFSESSMEQMLTFRFRLFLHKDKLTDEYLIYNRWESSGDIKRYSSLLAYFQPVVAWLGLLGCFLVVCIFSTASWWNGDITFKKVAVAYGGVSRLYSLSLRRSRNLINTDGTAFHLTPLLAHSKSQDPEKRRAMVCRT